MIRKVQTYLFYLTVFLIPLNLGQHFIYKWSYVRGLLVDYFVPTVYVQDILMAVLLLLWFCTLRKRDLLEIVKLRFIPLLVLFIFSVFFSVLASPNLHASLYAFSRLLLYVCFFFYVMQNFDVKKDFSRLVGVFSVSVFLLSLLAFGQWYKQGAVFNNYLFFGEQPYNFSTYGINRESLFGFTRIPAYGLFSHPNVFGGFLAIVLLWVLMRVPESKFATLSFLMGLIALFFTLSFSAWMVLLLGLLFLYLPRKASLFLTLALLFVLFFLPLFRTQSVSIERRASLLSGGYSLVSKSPLFGVGLGMSPSLSPDPRFLQPIHNVFVLIFAESGVFALLFFVAFLIFSISASFGKKLLFVSLLQILILCGFDHYFYTAHQTQLLLWLVLGVIFAYDSVTPSKYLY